MALALDVACCIGTFGVVLVSFEARSPRLLSWNGSPHFSTHTVPLVAVEVPQHPVARRDGHSSHTSHQKTSEASPNHVAVTCHRPPQPHSLSPHGSKFQHVRSWISREHGKIALLTVPCQAILACLKTFPQPSRVSDRPLHHWMTCWYFHIIPRFQTLHDRSRHALNSSVCLFHPAT